MVIIMNNSEETNHSGYINLKESRHFAYELLDGRITIHAIDRIPEIEKQNLILTDGHDNKKYLMYSQVPIRMSEINFYPQNYSQDIDWVIKQYQPNSKFNRVQFDFQELQYFCPSTSIVKESGDDVIFTRNQRTIKEFDIEIQEVQCHVSFIVGCRGSHGLAHSHIEAVSIIQIDFPETDNLLFLEAIYSTVDSVFSFLCNRKNTGCLSMKLYGNYETKTIDHGKMIDVIRPYGCSMFFFDKYREAPEKQNVISKAFYSSLMLPYIDKLFELVADDVTGKLGTSASISISSMHPSLKKRNLIDLHQSLHITGAFEFYVRRYLPEMVEEKTPHIILKMLLLEFANKYSGKTKKLAKNLAANVVREPSLQEKIEMVYGGYKDWIGVKECLEEDWFSNDVSLLAKSANEWRNELAHEKRSYEPDIETIRAIRLVEHLNYIIMLRQLGCSDLEIKEFLRNVLVR